MSVLTFDPARDENVRQSPLHQKYLNFYGMPAIDQVKHCMGYMPSGNYQIATQYWMPESPKGTVLIVHGYFDHMGLYGHLVRYLLEKNYAVVGLDLPGHGLSSGENVSIESFHHYVQVVSHLLDNIRNFPAPFHGVGQSTGGAILMNYLLLSGFLFQPILLDRVVLLAPLIKPVKWLRAIIGQRLLKRFRTHVPRRFVENSTDQQFLDFIRDKDPLQSKVLSVPWVSAMRHWVRDFSLLPKCKHPITVIQGEEDETIHWKYNLRRIRRKFPKARIIRVPDARHHLVNESVEIRNQVFEEMGFK
ncbi:MAG: alpha/beta hydrolase [bacterium]